MGLATDLLTQALKMGNKLAGNYFEIATDGSVRLAGDATCFDDMRVSPNSLPLIGSNPPTHKIVANDGVVGTGNSMHFDGVDDKGTVADYAALDVDTNGDLSGSFWTKPYSNTGPIIYRGNYFEVAQNYADLVISFASSWDISIPNVITLNATHHIVFSVEKIASNRSNLIVMVNGIERYNSTVWGYVFDYAESTDFLVTNDGAGNFYNGDIDELHLYNVALTNAQMLELYNAGDGIETVPSGITEATDLILQFSDTTTNLSTLGSGHDITLAGGPVTADSLIAGTGTAGSTGVAGLAFLEGQVNEIFFTRQVTHKYVLESDLTFHLHISFPDNISGNTVWGLEYMWVSIGGTCGNTTVVEKTFALDGADSHLHLVEDLFVLDGTDHGISSMLSCRLYRKGNDVADTFAGDICLGECDFHVEIDGFGSKTEWVK